MDTVNVDDGVIVRVVVVHKIRLDGEVLGVCVWRARRIHGICVQSKQLRRFGEGLKTLEDRNDEDAIIYGFEFMAPSGLKGGAWIDDRVGRNVD